MERATGSHNPVDVAEQWNIVDMLQNVLTKHVIKRIACKRERQLLNVVYDVDTSKYRAVEIDPIYANVVSTTEM